MLHELKTHPAPFSAVWVGLKNFEVRRNDRNYKVGDTLLLKEYFTGEPGPGNPAGEGRYSGDEITAEIKYILEGGQYGIEKGFVVMGIVTNQKTTRDGKE